MGSGKNGSLEPWVETNVVPFLDTVPEPLVSPRLNREQAAKSLSAWLIHEYEMQSMAAYPELSTIEIVADWPEDIAQICMLLVIGSGARVDIPQMSFRLVELPGFSTAANSKVPHNALHDARALRDHVLTLEP